MINVVCVNANNYLGRGQDYVDRLQYGVSRHLGAHKFHVLTEKDVPPGIEGWWAKLAMFKPGRFEGRCLYFDLDTLIVGSIGHIANYRGGFAALSDFYRPESLASGVMTWEAGRADHIWTRWVQCGMPQFHQYGDGGWINDVIPEADRLQTLFPSQIVSFKAHCLDGIPEGARVVCFHGKPRPHVLSDILDHWQ